MSGKGNGWAGCLHLELVQTLMTDVDIYSKGVGKGRVTYLELNPEHRLKSC